MNKKKRHGKYRGLKILLTFVGVIALLVAGGYLMLRYRESTKKVIALDKLDQIELVQKDNRLWLKGDADISKHRRIFVVDGTQSGNDAYIYIMEVFSFKQNSQVHFDITDTINREFGTNTPIKNYYLVSGAEICGQGATRQENYTDATKYDQRRDLPIKSE
ncbi:hypothetical protein ACFQHW_02570 [Lapidilactobacillus achengensis]|uniref:Uncharacterized protein n=1 Tax=Lapidilactobacillus achengensis TaxID=2486000 RepID=A0ABW1UKI7_9LACO|nr:hypothetical protein [Lapidilactobacillus achengensis]